ncbi:MAG: TIGR03960 family B12-binding radical SAM protein [Bacillota bacterium]
MSADVRFLVENEVLPFVKKPGRYLGNEWNSIRKSWDETAVRMVFAFPDVYEIGMSHLGLQILYGLVNQHPHFLMERVFAPGVDMEELLRAKGIPLFSLESYRPLKDFDVIGFTLQYEMSFTNILNILDLAGIPLHGGKRGAGDPLVIAGGPGAFNPEPLADFIDLFLVGDSEESLPELLSKLQVLKQEGADREQVVFQMAQISGVYAPSLYQPVYSPDGRLQKTVPLLEGLPHRVAKRVIRDLDEAYFPLQPIVPAVEVVHDRIMLEVLRGCTRGCRFCQAGAIYRPVRERSQEVLLNQAMQIYRATGHEEISLTSLSTADYSCVQPLATKLLDLFQEHRVGISLPSLRVDSFSVDLAQEIQRVRRSGLTFAPEAGTQRLRDIINKGVTEEDLFNAAEKAFRAGWHSIKLYFMIGLPMERNEDLDGIISLAHRVLAIGRRVKRETNQGKNPSVTISVSSFVPKAHTPFQWVAQDSIAELKRKQYYLKSKLKDRGLNFNWHQSEISFLEGVFARGDRRLGRVLEAAWGKGCKFDSWQEHFKFQSWMEAFAEAGIDPLYYTHRQIPLEEVLPWDHIDSGVSKEYLIKEYQAATELAPTGDCRWEKCPGCGVCFGLNVDVLLKGGTGDAPSQNRIR